MGICYLVGAGDFYGQITAENEDIIIAADGGYDNLVRRGITPDILIGDFDSVKSEIPEGLRSIRYPKEKDETDMFLSYEAGVKLGYSEFVMLGATGGAISLFVILMALYMIVHGTMQLRLLHGKESTDGTRE